MTMYCRGLFPLNLGNWMGMRISSFSKDHCRCSSSLFSTQLTLSVVNLIRKVNEGTAENREGRMNYQTKKARGKGTSRLLHTMVSNVKTPNVASALRTFYLSSSPQSSGESATMIIRSCDKTE
jgi:hypothetical protein